MADPIFYPVARPTYRPLPRFTLPSSAPPPPPTSAPSGVSDAVAAELARAQRMFGDDDEEQSTADAGPVFARGYVGNRDAPSLLAQAGGLVRSIPAGIAGFVKQGAVTALAPFRLPYDYARGDVSNTELMRPPGSPLPFSPAVMHKYAPLPTELYESNVRTAGDVFHPTRFVEASREGNLVGKVFEDVANVSLLGSAASRVLGKVATPVEVAAAEAPAVGAETAIRAVGAAPATAADAFAPVVRTPFAERPLLQRLSEVAPTEANRVVQLPGRGLAGVAERAGHQGLAEGLARAGEITHTVSQFGERAANAPAGLYTYLPRQASRALKAVGGPDVPAVVRRGLTQAVERAGETGGVLFPFTDKGRQWSRLTAVFERSMTAVQREAIIPARLAAELKLTDPEARAALFLVDEAMYPTVQMVRKFGDRLSDAEINEVIDRMYIDPLTGKPVDASMRPTPADVRALVDYADGNIDPAAKTRIDTVTNAMGERAAHRRDSLLEEGLLDPAQVGTDLLPNVVSKYQRVPEVARGRAQRALGKEFPRLLRAGLEATAYEILAEELPDSPLSTGLETGQAIERYANQRRALDASKVELADAVDEYQALSEEGPSERLQAAEQRVARLVARSNELRREVKRVARQEDAATALSRATGEIEQGAPRIMGPNGEVIEGQARVAGERPVPDISKAETVTELRRRAKEIGQAEATATFDELEAMVGSDRMTLPADPWADQPPPPAWEVAYGSDSAHMTTTKRFATQAEAEAFLRRLRRQVGTVRYTDYSGGEWNWWYELPVATRKAMQSEGWMKGRVSAVGQRRLGTGLSPDQFAELMNAGQVNEAMPVFVDLFERWRAAKGGRAPATLEQLAVETGLPHNAVVQAVRGKLADYTEALVDPVVDEISGLREAYVDFTPDERALFDSTLDQLRADPNITPDDFASMLSTFFPELDVTGSQGILATFGNMVDVEDVLHYVRTGDQTTTFRAKLGPRLAAQNYQLGQLAGQRGGLGSLAREVERERKAAEQEAAGARREATAKLSAAKRNVENTAAVAEGRQKALDASGAPPRLPARASVWERAEGAEMSPGERLRLLQGRAQQRYNLQVAKVNRLERTVRYQNEKVGNMRSELSRGMVDRLVNDVNRPMMTRWRNIVRKAGEPLGALRGRRDARRLDGLLGRLGKAYGVYDDLIVRLEALDSRGGGLTAVTDDGSSAGTGSFVEDAAVVFEDLLADNGKTLSTVDAQAFKDSVATDLLLEEVNARQLADARRGLTPNTPLRVREIISHGLRTLPDDIRSQFDQSWTDYQRRRGNLLNRDFDRYAEAVPAAYRTLTQTGRRQIRAALEIAEQKSAAHPGAGDVYIDMAVATMDTLSEFVAEGVEPTHLIAGADVQHPFSAGGQGGRSRFTERKLRAQQQRRTGLRTLDPAAQARVEADQLARVLHNRQAAAVKAHMDDGGFGRRADDVLAGPIAQHLAETGEAMSPEAMSQAAADAGWVSTEPRAAVNEQTMLIPEAIAKQSEDYGLTKTHVFKWFASTNRMWKSWVLPLSTKWLTGNMFGNALSAAFYRGIDPFTLAARMREIKRMNPGGRWADLWDQDGMPDWAPAQLASHGLGWRDFKVLYEPVESQARTPLGRLIAKSYKLNEFTDNLTRAAVYLEEMRRGVPSEAAMTASLNALGDFTRMSRFERRIVKEVIPFYAWLRHQTQATLRLPIESPARAAWLMHLADLYTDPDERDGLLELIGAGIPLRSGEFIDIGSISPLAEIDPFQTPFSPTAIGRSVSPALRFPIAAATGLDIAKLGPISRPAGGIHRGPYGQEETTPFWATMLHGRPLQGLGELGYVFSQQTAPTQVRSLRDIALGPNARYGTGYEIGSATGDYLPANRGSLLNQLARAAGVPSIRHIDLVEARRRAEEQQRRQRG